MNHRSLPDFPYGAVYFRKSNPPREDWARDYRTAAEDSMTVFRHWFLWSAIESPPASMTGRIMTDSSTWPSNTASRRSSPR